MKRQHLGRRAAASVEFAFCGLALMLMVFLILNLGDLALVLGAMTYSTQVTAREAALQSGANLGGVGTASGCLSQAQIISIFNNAMPSILPAATNGGTGLGAPAVQSGWVQGSGTGTYLQITTRYNWVAPGGISALTVPLTVSEMQMVQGSSGTVAASCTAS